MTNSRLDSGWLSSPKPMWSRMACSISSDILGPDLGGAGEDDDVRTACVVFSVDGGLEAQFGGGVEDGFVDAAVALLRRARRFCE